MTGRPEHPHGPARRLGAALGQPKRQLPPDVVAAMLRLHAAELPARDHHIAQRLRERARQLEEVADDGPDAA